MDISTILGMVGGTLLILISIIISPGAELGGFWSTSSVLVVICGAIAALMICFPLKVVLGAFSIMKNVIFNKTQNIGELIQLIVSLAETARRDGLLALENRLEEIESNFLTLGIQMAIDGTRPEIIEGVMRTEMDAVEERHASGKAVMDQMGRFAPAFGMIGTLMGLIIMLGNMSPDTNRYRYGGRSIDHALRCDCLEPVLFAHGGKVVLPQLARVTRDGDHRSWNHGDPSRRQSSRD